MVLIMMIQTDVLLFCLLNSLCFKHIFVILKKWYLPHSGHINRAEHYKNLVK